MDSNFKLKYQSQEAIAVSSKSLYALVMYLSQELVLVLSIIKTCVSQKVKLTSDPLYPSVGDRVTVTCQLTDRDTPTSFQMSLKYNDKMVAEVRYKKAVALEYQDMGKHGIRTPIQSHFNMMHKQCSASFTADSQYHGAWSCEWAIDQTEEYQQNVSLLIKKTPKVKVFQLKGHEISNNVYIEKASIIPICTVEIGFPLASVKMTYKGVDMGELKEINQTQDDSKYLGRSYSGPTMTLKDTDDGSQIVCRAHNSVGDHEMALNITVLYPVRDVRLDIKKDVVNCSARGNPTPKLHIFLIELIRDDAHGYQEKRSVKGVGNVRFRFSQELKPGKYRIQCSASNIVNKKLIIESDQFICSWNDKKDDQLGHGDSDFPDLRCKGDLK